MLDDAGKIHSAVTGFLEGIVDALRMRAERRRGTRGLGGFLRQAKVLQHQRGSEARLVIVV